MPPGRSGQVESSPSCAGVTCAVGEAGWSGDCVAAQLANSARPSADGLFGSAV